MGARLADPVLPLQTMNAHCIAVRAAANAVNNPANLSPAEMDHLIRQAGLAVEVLRYVFRCVGGDVRLEGRCEAAGKATKALVTSLEVKRANVGGVH